MMVLNPKAKEFTPSYDVMVETHPHLPGSSGFVLLDERLPHFEVPDEELFDFKVNPVSPYDAAELDDMDMINSLLAEIDMDDTLQDLHLRLREKREDARANETLHSVLSNVMKSSLKLQSPSHADKKKHFSKQTKGRLNLP